MLHHNIMVDTLSKTARSLLMGEVKARYNKSTEIKLARLLRASGVKGWRRHLNLPGVPDFTFRKERVCVFVDGCFWHGCPKHYSLPKSNVEFWKEKIKKTRERDIQVNKELKEKGYVVLRIWECEMRDRDRVLKKIQKALHFAPNPAHQE